MLLGLGLVLIVEGMIYALAPDLSRRIVAMLRALSDAELRRVGILAALLGLVLAWSATLLGVN